MNKDKALEILEEFYEHMNKSELLAYESCNKMYAEQQDIYHTYADVIVKEHIETHLPWKESLDLANAKIARLESMLDRESIKQSIDAFFTDRECPSNDVYSDELTDAIIEAITKGE